MPLLRKGAIDASPWGHHQSDAEPAAHRLVTLADYLTDPAAWHRLEGPWVAVLQPTDDAAELPAALLREPRLAVAFPTFTDGRGYSLARQLRQQLGYTGELIASGDVRRDQIDFMARVGFDSFECRGDIDIADWQKALSELHVQGEPV